MLLQSIFQYLIFLSEKEIQIVAVLKKGEAIYFLDVLRLVSEYICGKF